MSERFEHDMGASDDAAMWAFEPRLRPLAEIGDYDISDDDPDIRGWDVRSSDGRLVGHVRDLIVDTVAMEVRYMVVELDRDVTEQEGAQRVLLPVGTARLSDDAPSVQVERMDAAHIARLPRWQCHPIDDDFERALCEGIAGETPADLPPPHAHHGPLFDTKAFWGDWGPGRTRTAYLVVMGSLRRGARDRRHEERGDRRAS